MTTSDKLIIGLIYESMYDDTIEEGWKSKLAGAGLATMAGLGAMKGYHAMGQESPHTKSAMSGDISGVRAIHDLFIDHVRLKSLIGDYLMSKHIQFNDIDITNDQIIIDTERGNSYKSLPQLRQAVTIANTSPPSDPMAIYIFKSLSSK